MKLLEDRILKDGRVLPGNVLKVDNFLNHQIDVQLLDELGKEFARLYKDCGVTKIMTIEASGIAIACAAAKYFDYCQVVFAKKNKTSNISPDFWVSDVKSYTTGNIYKILVSKEFLRPDDRVLLLDDFMANGAALNGLIDLVSQSGATLIGAGIAVEKAFQPGGERIRSRGIRVESLARVKSMSPDHNIEFCD